MRLVAACLAAASLGATAGCSSIGSGVADGLHQERGKLAEVADTAGGAAVRGAGRSFADSVRPELLAAIDSAGHRLRDSLVVRTLDELEGRALRMEDSLAAFVAGRGNEAVRTLVTGSLDEARGSIDASVARWMATLSASVDSQLRLAVAAAAAEAAGRALDSMGARLDSSRSLGLAVEELGGRVVQRAIDVIRENTERDTPWWVWAGGGLVVLALLAGIGRFVLGLVAESRRREASLRIVARAIQERGATDVADRVRGLATQQGMEGWLNRFLEERRLLVEERAPGGPPGGPSPGPSGGPSPGPSGGRAQGPPPGPSAGPPGPPPGPGAGPPPGSR